MGGCAGLGCLQREMKEEEGMVMVKLLQRCLRKVSLLTFESQNAAR